MHYESTLVLLLTNIFKHIKYLIIILTSVTFQFLYFIHLLHFKCTRLQLHCYKCVNKNIFKSMTYMLIDIALYFSL